MIRRLIKLVVVLVVLGLIALAAYGVSRHPGYVLISYQGFRYESTLWFFLGLLVVVLIVLWLLRLVVRLLLLSNPWSGFNRHRRAGKSAELGMQALAEDQWSSALGHLKKAAANSKRPLPLLLGAARAANHLDQTEERDALLNTALQQKPGAELAIELERAKLQEANGDFSGALKSLQGIHRHYPHHKGLNLRLLRLLERLHRWPDIFALLPALRKFRKEEEVLALQRQAWQGYLRDIQASPATTEANPAQLASIWKQLPALHDEPAMVVAYANALHCLGADDNAEQLLRKAARAQYRPEYAEVYGRLASSDPAGQLKQAERWLPEHAQDPALLRCLGRLSQACSLWGKARDYLQSSLNFARQPETCVELARLLDQMGEPEASQRMFLESLALRELQPEVPSTPAIEGR